MSKDTHLLPLASMLASAGRWAGAPCGVQPARCPVLLEAPDQSRAKKKELEGCGVSAHRGLELPPLTLFPERRAGCRCPGATPRRASSLCVFLSGRARGGP